MMRAIDAAARVLKKEGVACTFSVPGAAINLLYSALRSADRSIVFSRAMSARCSVECQDSTRSLADDDLPCRAEA